MKENNINILYLLIGVYLLVLSFCTLIGVFCIFGLEIDKISYGDILNAFSTLAVGVIVAIVITIGIEKKKSKQSLLISECILLKQELHSILCYIKKLAEEPALTSTSTKKDEARKLLFLYIKRLDNITKGIKEYSEDDDIFKAFSTFRKFSNNVNNTTFVFDNSFYCSTYSMYIKFDECIRRTEHGIISK